MSRAFAKLWNAYDPHVGFDLHTSDGSTHGYYLTYAPGLNPNTSSAILDIQKLEWFPAVTKAIKAKQASFVSRGDRSGTHLAELRLWKEVGIDIGADRAGWYKWVGILFTDTANVGLNHGFNPTIVYQSNDDSATMHDVVYDRVNIFQKLSFADAQALADVAIEEFTSGRASRVDIVFNEFKSVISQRVVTEQLLPMAIAPAPAGTCSCPARWRRGTCRCGAPASITIPGLRAETDTASSRSSSAKPPFCATSDQTRSDGAPCNFMPPENGAG